MYMYNLNEHSDNFFYTSGSLCQFRRDEINGNAGVTTANSSSFKYRSNLIGDVAAKGVKGVKLAVWLKYLSNFWQSLKFL